MLMDRYPPQTLRIQPRWHPYPCIADRAAWEGIPADVRRWHLERAEALLGRPWPALPAHLYLEFARQGNRGRFETPYFERRATLAQLVLAECMEDRGRYLDAVADGLWLISEESTWCLPAHISAQEAGSGLPDTEEPILDLFAAETGAALAWTAYLLGSRLDRVSPLLLKRIRREVRRRVLDPFLTREDLHWMGFLPGRGRPNNWNPWINSNVLPAGLLLEDEEQRRVAIVSRAMRSLDRFLDPYPRDGGCDEGPAYWGRAGGSVFDCLETLCSATGGQIDLWSDPLIREIGAFIYRAHIAQDYYVNFADAPPILRPSAGVVFTYGERIGDADMMRLGATLLRGQSDVRLDGISPERPLRELFLAARAPTLETSEPLPRDVWLRDIQVMVARDRGGSSAGLFAAAKGGHNAESHNHNDVGSFIVYTDGRPLVVDAGVGEYTRATFSPERYTIWTMQSAFHSLLPTVDGIMQAPGAELAARDVRYAANDAEATLELDIAGAYPEAAGIRTWRRRLTLHRGKAVEVSDSFTLGRDAQQIVLSILTPCAAALASPGEIALREAVFGDGRRSGQGRILVGGGSPRPELSVERVDITDARLQSIWGSHMGRALLTLRGPVRSGSIRVTITGAAS